MQHSVANSLLMWPTASPRCWQWSRGGPSSDWNCPCWHWWSTWLMLPHGALSPAVAQSPRSRATPAWSAGSSVWPVRPPEGEQRRIRPRSSRRKGPLVQWLLEETNLLSFGFWHSKLIVAEQERPHLLTQGGLYATKVDQSEQLLLLICLRTKPQSPVGSLIISWLMDSNS